MYRKPARLAAESGRADAPTTTLRGVEHTHERRYRASLVALERPGVIWALVTFVVISLIDAIYLLGILDFNPVSDGEDSRLTLVARLLMVASFAKRLVKPSCVAAYGVNCALWTLMGCVMVQRACSGPEEENDFVIQVIQALIGTPALVLFSFFLFRRHATAALVFAGVVAGGLAVGLRDIPDGLARYLAPYVVSLLTVFGLLAMVDSAHRRAFMAEQQNHEADLKDIEIAALTQISHVIKNKLNFVESMLPDWRERISKQKIEDPHNDFGRTPHIEDFGMMEFCIRASLDAVMYVWGARTLLLYYCTAAAPAYQTPARITSPRHHHHDCHDCHDHYRYSDSPTPPPVHHTGT